MSYFDDLILKRRSIRHFDAKKPVTKENISLLIHAALEAPSWNNFQTSRYHIVMSEKKKKQLCEYMAPFDANISINAQALIVTTYIRDLSGFKGGEPVDELGNGWGIYDLGLQNALLLLKATDLELDSIVLGLRDADQIRTLLHIPEEEIIVSIIAIGYKAKDAIRPKRKETEKVTTFY